MPNILQLTIPGSDGFELARFFDDLEQGLFTLENNPQGQDGTALFSTDATTLELRIGFTTIDGELHATGFALTEPTPQGLEIELTATFDAPEPLGVPVWTDLLPLSLYDALLGDTRMDLRGGPGNDIVTGTEFGDRLRLGGGDDIAAGEAGNDILLGGRGNDLLTGGADDDQLAGGGNNDMLIAGAGDNRADGGAGNDVLVFTEGFTLSKGGRGSDIFMVDASSLPGSQTRVVDHKSDDFMVFTGMSLQGGTVYPATATLADLEAGAIDDFLWRDTAQGVEIQAGNSQVLLSGVDADEVGLDQLLFTDQSLEEAVMLFDGTATEEVLGRTPGGDTFIAFGDEGTGSTFISDGSEVTGFIAFGTEGTGFIEDAFSFV